MMLKPQLQFLLSAFCLTVVTANSDGQACPGPLAYYDALECKPIRYSPSDACAYKYDCDHLKKRSSQKCYVNNKPYDIGESLREEDANPCDIGCTCTMGHDGIATFNCAVVDCFHGPLKPGCFRRNSPFDCCPGEEVCPKNPEDRAKCNVGGNTYLEGEFFQIGDKSCTCSGDSEVKGPVCAAPKHPYCSPDFRHASDIINNCSPVYYSSQSPQTSCSVFARCANPKDKVIKGENVGKPSGDENKNSSLQCLFGKMVLNIGDELNQATDYSSVCVKCVCEVPPVLTCQRLPDEECDVTKHPVFSNSD